MTTNPCMSGALARLRSLLVAGALALPALAAPVQAVTLLTEENPPFNYTENGKLTGLVTELVVEAAKRANVPYTIEVLPWGPRVQAHAGGKGDVPLRHGAPR